MQEMFTTSFGNLSDPRIDRTKKHNLLAIIGISLCAVMAGAQGWEEIEDFGQDHQDWFSTFLSLPNGIPSHDTIARVFSLLDPKAFELSCINWFEALQVRVPENTIPIDGKTLRGSSRSQSGLKGLHIVNAWSCANSICLGQEVTDKKSNEITAIPVLLKQLCIKNATVTIDAMGCQQAIASQIREAEGHYIFGLKGNQGDLHTLAQDTFNLADGKQKTLAVYHAEDALNNDHGRIEQRCIDVIDASKLKEQFDSNWKDLTAFIRITASREQGDTTSTEQRFYISSLPYDKPADIMQHIRAHWQVENCLHWSLDVSFSEDNCRVREQNAAANLSWMRKFVLGLLKKEASFKRASIRRKQRKCHHSVDYISKVIKGI